MKTLLIGAGVIGSFQRGATQASRSRRWPARACRRPVRGGGDVKQLARKPELLRLFVRSFREGLDALSDIGVPLTPWFAQLFCRLPEPIFVAVIRRFFDTELAVVGGQRHANAAPDEMKEIADELRTIFRRSGRPTPASDILFPYVDARAMAEALSRVDLAG